MLSMAALWQVFISIVLIANSQASVEVCDPPVCEADQNEVWSYRGDNGPAYWCEIFKSCGGHKQSPIDICPNDAVPDPDLCELELINYDVPVSCAKIQNTGTSVQVIPTDEKRGIILYGKAYFLQNVNFHFGFNKRDGTEHTISGRQYTMEAHFVHKSKDGKIAIVAVLFKESRKRNKALSVLVKDLCNVQYKDTETELSSDMDLCYLLPSNPLTDYYRYIGSFTVPECSEGVIWTVAGDPVTVSHSQMEAFRTLYSACEEEAEEGCTLAGNIRPVQPLNGRTVYHYCQ